MPGALTGPAAPPGRVAASFSRDCRDVLACAVEAARADGPAGDPAVHAAAARLLAADPCHPGLGEIEALARHVTARDGVAG